MRMDVHGMKTLVIMQLKKVTSKCSNTYMRMGVHGINGLVLMQLEEVTWKCSNTHMRMGVLGMWNRFVLLEVIGKFSNT